MKIRLWLAAILAAVLLFLACGISSHAFAWVPDGRAKKVMPLGAHTIAPVGYIGFCTRHWRECTPNRRIEEPMALTPQREEQLSVVNREVNHAFRPATDEEIYSQVELWEYPHHGMADCEDYALEKRRRLIRLGWHASQLLVTVVKDERGAGHAVLTARTDMGDIVLDNKRPAIMLWKLFPYDFLKRQSLRAPLVWDEVAGPAPLFTSSSH